ncbi:hypothetical protein ACFQJC_13135 [Haloferax namakaokahaiae]|uniref:Uncharacterized protein n=1 Tax=Haloferax namakaokahaiae TaxID=1748331 RepID=A0ABD5ZGQ9_9EURY
MRRRALLASLSPVAFTGLLGLVALALDPETTVRLALQLFDSAVTTGEAILSYLRRAAPLSTMLFAGLAWLSASGFRLFLDSSSVSNTRTTAEYVFALVFSACLPLVAVFARDRPAVVAGVVVAFLASLGAIVAGRTQTKSVMAGAAYTVGPVAVSAAIASVLVGPVASHAVTLVLPAVVGYSLGTAAARGLFRTGAIVSAACFAIPAWLYFPPAAEAAGFDLGAVGFALTFAVVAALFALPFGTIGYIATATE